MRFAVLALVAVACERADPPTPSPPRPRDAAVDCVRVPDGAARVAALDRLRARVAIPRSEHSPVEAPVELTNAYVGFELAYGYARLGRAQIARELLASGRAALDTNDPIHGYLAAAYGVRIEQALGCRPPGAPLGSALDARLAALERLARYKVDRLREASLVLTTDHVDAIDAFTRRRRGARNPFDEVLTLGGDSERARALAAILDTVAAHPNDHEYELGETLDAIRALPGPAAKPLAERAIALVRAQPTWFRFNGRVLQLAASFDRGAVPSLVEAIGRLAPHATAPDLEAVLADSVRALRDDTTSLRTLWSAMSEPGDPASVAYAAGLLRLGDRGRAQPILDRTHLALGSLKPGARAEMLRLLALAYSVAPTDLAIAGAERLAPAFATETDSYGTNTHFTLSVVGLISVLVVAIAGE